MRGPRLVSALAAALAGAPVTAVAFPYETADADVAAGLEVTGLVEAEQGREGRQTAPALDLTWALRPQVLELAITTGAAQISPAVGGARRGMDDTEVAAKWKFRDGGEGGLSLAVEPAMVVPTGDGDGLGGEQWRYALPLIVQMRRGPMTYYANVAWSDRIGGGDGEVSAGLVAERGIGERLSLGVELAGAAPAGDWRQGRLDANLGFRLKLAEELELQALVGRSLNGRREGPVTLMRVGLQYAL